MESVAKKARTVTVAAAFLLIGLVLGATLFGPGQVMAQGPAGAAGGSWSAVAVGTLGAVVVSPEGKVFLVGIKDPKVDHRRKKEVMAEYFADLKSIGRSSRPMVSK